MSDKSRVERVKAVRYHLQLVKGQLIQGILRLCTLLSSRSAGLGWLPLSAAGKTAGDGHTILARYLRRGVRCGVVGERTEL